MKRKKFFTPFGKFIIGFIIFLIFILGFMNKLSEDEFRWKFLNIIHKNFYQVDKIQKSNIHEELIYLDNPNSEKDGKWYGLCKKQSINSIEDFRKTVESDYILAIYYGDFNWNNATISKLNESKQAFVAHRKGDIIAKTIKPIKLPKNDKIITDGIRIVRTYCCNDIILNPSAGVPDKPIIKTIPFQSILEPLETVPEQNFTYNSIIHGNHGKPKPVTPVPEPSTFLLMIVGLLFLAKRK